MSEYVRQKLLFFVAQDVDDELRLSIKKLIERLTAKRNWVIEPPGFVDMVDAAGSRPEDVRDVTVGGSLIIFSALESGLPKDIDLKHLQEVEEIVTEVQALSRAEGVSFEFELDGKFVGAIDDGLLDRSLSEGFLGEWRRHFGV